MALKSNLVSLLLFFQHLAYDWSDRALQRRNLLQSPLQCP
jgi:hypothetical protein